MSELSGLGPKSRERLSQVLRGTKGTVTPNEASKILKLPVKRASILLSYWTERGWLKRVQRGLYVPIPLEAMSKEISVEDPWIIAMKIFEPCYIGGWSAVEYWDFTEQIFSSIVVFTTKKVNKRELKIDNIPFKIKTISEEKIFGLKTVWRGKAKIKVSDQNRTILDLLVDPSIGGGMRPVRDFFKNYLKSNERDLQKLIDYCIEYNVGTVFKRLGFLLELEAPKELRIIKICRDNISSGYSKLDPALSSPKIVTKWKLKVPESWKKEVIND